MWLRTLVGCAVSFLINGSVMTSLSLLLPLRIDVKLLLSFVLGFCIWAGLMTYFYCCEHLRRSLTFAGAFLGVSVAVNTLILMLG